MITGEKGFDLERDVNTRINYASYRGFIALVLNQRSVLIKDSYRGDGAFADGADVSHKIMPGHNALHVNVRVMPQSQHILIQLLNSDGVRQSRITLHSFDSICSHTNANLCIFEILLAGEIKNMKKERK